MPGSAAGRITRLIVSDRVAPSPSEPSRSDRGTEVMMSSESEETKGISMIAHDAARRSERSGPG